jgi:hypothetical protein
MTAGFVGLKTGKINGGFGAHGNNIWIPFLNQRQNIGLPADKNYVFCIQTSGKIGSTNYARTYLRVRWCMM